MNRITVCSTDSSQIAHSSFVIFLKSVTWAHRVAVLGWQAAVLLMSYFTVFTLSNCPQFTSALGALCSALTRRASVNERFGLTSRRCSVAAKETLHSDSMYYLIKMNSRGFLSFPAPLSIYWACMLFLNIPHTPARSITCLAGFILLLKVCDLIIRRRCWQLYFEAWVHREALA